MLHSTVSLTSMLCSNPIMDLKTYGVWRASPSTRIVSPAGIVTMLIETNSGCIRTVEVANRPWLFSTTASISNDNSSLNAWPVVGTRKELANPMAERKGWKWSAPWMRLIVHDTESGPRTSPAASFAAACSSIKSPPRKSCPTAGFWIPTSGACPTAMMTGSEITDMLPSVTERMAWKVPGVV